ncbi:MAG: type VI secretion system tube protein Hcp [Terriglobia bacterium]|jgi:type VI secretion system secreted protein Hcp
MPPVPVVGLPAIRSGVEIHLDLASIQGESLSLAHKDEIEISSFQWGVSNSPVNTKDGATKGGRVSMTEITVTKFFDKASVQLVKAAATGQILKTAKISWSKSTGDKAPEDFLTITLAGVLITSVQQSSSRSGEGMGSETVTLAFDKISMDYKVQSKSGLLTSAAQMAYDLAQGKMS